MTERAARKSTQGTRLTSFTVEVLFTPKDPSQAEAKGWTLPRRWPGTRLVPGGGGASAHDPGLGHEGDGFSQQQQHWSQVATHAPTLALGTFCM